MQHSPFENIFNIIGGQANEKPIKRGFYNAFALLILAASSAAVYVLYLILEPFIKPLFWAVLVGSLLHPFKYRLAKQLKAWFEELEKANTSILFGITLIPINAINLASIAIGTNFTEHYKVILGSAGAVFLLPWLYNSVPRAVPCLCWQAVNMVTVLMLAVIKIFNFYVMLTTAVGYFILIYFTWTPQRDAIFRKTSFFMWLGVSGYMAGLAGSWQVYAFVLLQLLAVAGFAAELLYIHHHLQEKDPDVSIFKAINMTLSNKTAQTDFKSDESENEGRNIENDEQPKTVIESRTPEHSNVDSPISSDKVNVGNRRLYKTHTLSSFPLTNIQYLQSLRNVRNSLNESDLKTNFRIEDDEDETALYFKLLFFGCSCVLIWKQMWLLPVMLFFLAIHLIKKVGAFVNLWSFIENYYKHGMQSLKDWWTDRKAAIVPAHVRGLIRLAASLNRGARAAAYESVDTVSSCFVITGLLLFLTSASIFLCVQIYSEAVVVVQLGGSVLNSSMVRDSAVWEHLPEGWEESLDSLLDNAYTYGREGLSKVVRGVLKEGEEEKVARVEHQVLELFDRIYQSWMANPTHGPKVDGRAVSDSWDNLFTDITASPGIFNYAGLAEWLQANVGTLTAIAGSVWAPLASNLSLLTGSVGALFSVLLLGGTAILNFLFSLVVFFTTLFYLLASSGSLYKPVEAITQMHPSFGPRLGMALSVAINQVFRASFKMALFYGLWTWLVHNLFGASVVYLPSALAAVLGAAPFLGTWLACVPAALELWLAQGRPVAAILLPIAQFAPVSFVDAAIYKEIRNGGHPYLTGLAIAGGIFFFGAEGAILGPLLLCSLLVVFNLSSALMRDTPTDERAVAAATLQSRIRMGAII